MPPSPMSVSSSKVMLDSPGMSSRKKGIWGPTHTYESDETSAPEQILQDSKLTQSANGGTHTTKTSDSSSEHGSPGGGTHPTTNTNLRTFSPLSSGGSTLERILESASAVVESIVKSASSSLPKSPTAAAAAAAGASTTASLKGSTSPDVTGTTIAETPSPRVSSAFELFVEEACTTSPCAPRKVDDSPPRRRLSRNDMDDDDNDDGMSQLGIGPMISPAKSPSTQQQQQQQQQRHTALQSRVVSNTTDRAATMGRRSTSKTSSGLLGTSVTKTVNEIVELPMAMLTFEEQESHAISRSISELTMRSSYGDVSGRMAESRRMAYYAVGKHHKNSGRGGNRRCYFTGKLILGGAPFYAGSVQQGLRTLVVFCLPSAIGLPKDGTDHLFRKQHSDLTKRSNASSQGVIPLPREYMQQSASSLKHVSTKGSNISTSISKATSSVDDMSFLEEELDPNWDLDRDYLLQVLPEPSNDLLDEMNVRYPDQFETLPVQVRSPHCWRLFVKFCFFSGLPIAEGELHYKVRDEIAMDVYGEEIILSHEVMEAVNGESAEILRLPNLKTFKYLRKHYTQQSGKLTDVVFQRTSWELVRPEV